MHVYALTKVCLKQELIILKYIYLAPIYIQGAFLPTHLPVASYPGAYGKKNLGTLILLYMYKQKQTNGLDR